MVNTHPFQIGNALVSSCIVWFRQDLRLEDNPALQAALKQSFDHVIPLYVYDEKGTLSIGEASKWWLHHSLKALEHSLKEYNTRLIVQKGPLERVLKHLSEQHPVQAVYFNHRYEPAAVKQESLLLKLAKNLGWACEGFHGNLLFPPETIMNAQGKPFQIYSAFLKQTFKIPPKIELSYPRKIPSLPSKVLSLTIEQLHLLPKIHWTQEIEAHWIPGEDNAKKRLRDFMKRELKSYAKRRNYPTEEATSRLSPYLHFGEIAVGRVFHEIKKKTKTAHHPFINELIWREFASHLLYFFPQTSFKSFKTSFSSFPWKKKPAFMKRWQRGLTGYPIVDAGMRQLWRMGWMHNRVRMVVASFLIKDLLIPWQKGAKWFWDTLLDADLANNTLNWQWCAGCGADAMPFFRVFNPVLQGKKFDSKGEYIKKYLPELKDLPSRWIHEPWNAPKEILKQANVILGKTYPKPIIEHEEAKKQAVAYYKKLKKR